MIHTRAVKVVSTSTLALITKILFHVLYASITVKHRYYPIWEIPEGREVVLRFLPDLNESNPIDFVSEAYTHYIVTDPERPKYRTTVLCSGVHERGKECMHCKMAERHFRAGQNMDETMKWRKVAKFYANILVMRDSNNLTGIRNYSLMIGRNIFDQIREGILGLDYMPSDYKNGYNLHLSVEKAGHWRRYNAVFKKKKLSKPDTALANDSLIDLSTLHPTRYSSEFNEKLQGELTWDILKDTA